METRVIKYFPCTEVVTNVALETFAANAANIGKVAIVDQDWNALAAAVGAITATQLWDNEKLYVALKTSTGIEMSQPIITDQIRKRVAQDSVAQTSQVTVFDMNAYTPVKGQTYILRIVYKHNRDIFSERPNVWFYTAVADSTTIGDLVDKFVAQINGDTHVRNQITGSKTDGASGSDNELTLTGNSPEVVFDAALVTYNSSAEQEEVVVSPTTTTKPNLGVGHYSRLREFESYSKAYVGKDNRRGFPVDTINLATGTSGYYDLLTIEHDYNGPSTDIAKVRQLSPITTVIAIANADASTPAASYTALKALM